METVIKLNGINKIYRTDEVETQALENVNLEVRKGEFLSIMGPSGCGKAVGLRQVDAAQHHGPARRANERRD